MPTLEHNGKVVNQSTAIARYIAKQVKLVGNDDWENLEIDAIVDTITDIRISKLLNFSFNSKLLVWIFFIELAMYFYEPDEKVKAAREGPLFNEHLPYALTRLDKTVKNGYLACGRVSLLINKHNCSSIIILIYCS